MNDKLVNWDEAKVHVLTPCYGGLCHVNYVLQIMETKELLNKLGIEVTLVLMKNESLIQRGRNNLIAKAMADPNMTHVFFIDSDITWKPVDVLKLILADKEVVGGIYPLKKYHWDKLFGEEMKKIQENHKKSYNQSISEIDFIKQNLLKYNLNYLPNSKIANNIMEVSTLATGFMMIKRTCIEKMMINFKNAKYTDDCNALTEAENKYAYALFDCGIINDHYYSEDWMFCHRWREMGNHVYADVTIDLWHSGQEDYAGRLLSSLSIN